jgi:hypothetical protein
MRWEFKNFKLNFIYFCQNLEEMLKNFIIEVSKVCQIKWLTNQILRKNMNFYQNSSKLPKFLTKILSFLKVVQSLTIFY